jgi:hypothetical protein
VDADSREEAKIKAIRLIKDSWSNCYDAEIIPFSIFCIHRSSYEEFLEFCITSNKGTEKDIHKDDVRIFWDSISSLRKLENLSDYQRSYKIEYGEENPHFEESTDQFILDCFYAFPAIKHEILLPEIVFVEQIPLNVVQSNNEDYWVA